MQCPGNEWCMTMSWCYKVKVENMTSCNYWIARMARWDVKEGKKELDFVLKT